jgi:predicted nucleotidyltransferase
MPTLPDDLAAAAACDFARTLSARWQAQLGGDLIGLYIIGSLAHGGFSRRYSDIDAALITERGVTADALDKLRAIATQVSAERAGTLR